MQKIKILLSLIVLGYGFYFLYNHQRTREFLPIPAQVIQSSKKSIKTSPDRPGKYCYLFEYQYNYLGKRYRSTQYTYGSARSEAVCHYRVGDELVAYVNPSNPSDAVIKRELSSFVYALTGVGGVMLLQTVLAAWNTQSHTSKRLQKAEAWLGAMVGLTILLGGMGYFIYTLILATTQQCVN